MKTCDCKLYEQNIKEIDACIGLSTIHGFPYKGEYFRYCPWCGKELYEVYTGDSDHEHDDRIL